MWSCGLGDPLLWGALAFLLNYIPILGPRTEIGIFLIAGIVTLEWPWQALLPAACYTLIHIAEGEIVTPMLLANRFTLNPAPVIISLFFWHFLWGIPGALLAVATSRDVQDHLRSSRAFKARWPYHRRLSGPGVTRNKSIQGLKRRV